jgi:para-nitrobenzyl esterase
MAFDDVPHMRAGPPNSYELNEAVVCRRRAKGGIAWHWNVGIIAPPLPERTQACQ